MLLRSRVRDDLASSSASGVYRAVGREPLEDDNRRTTFSTMPLELSLSPRSPSTPTSSSAARTDGHAPTSPRSSRSFNSTLASQVTHVPYALNAIVTAQPTKTRTMAVCHASSHASTPQNANSIPFDHDEVACSLGRARRARAEAEKSDAYEDEQTKSPKGSEREGEKVRRRRVRVRKMVARRSNAVVSAKTACSFDLRCIFRRNVSASPSSPPRNGEKTKSGTHEDKAEDSTETAGRTDEGPPEGDVARPPDRDGRLVEIDRFLVAVEFSFKGPECDGERDGEAGREQDRSGAGDESRSATRRVARTRRHGAFVEVRILLSMYGPLLCRRAGAD